MIPARVDAVELRGERGACLAVGALLPEEVVATEREDADLVLGPELPGGARLVVPVLEHGVGGGERDERGGVRVAPGDEKRALAVGEGCLDESARIEEAHVALAV